MFKQMNVAAALVLMVLAVGTFQKTQAQESSPSKAASPAEKTLSSYRLDFSVNEMDDGKKINTRQYSMNLNSDSSNEIKIGTRVPVEAKQGQFEYIDVGTSIWSHLEERGGQVDLVVRSEISNFAMADQSDGHSARPLIRQLKIDASTLATLGKPLVIGSVDDPNSKRQFQLEVTVTKLR